MLVISTWTPQAITIDGEEIELRLKRMSVEEHIEFMGKFRRNAEPTFYRFVTREPDGEEQETKENGDYKLSLAQIFERRYENYSPEQKEEFHDEVNKDELKAKEFLIYTYKSFVRVGRGLMEVCENGEEKSVTAGIDFLRLFGARNDVLTEVSELLRAFNTVGPEKKRISKSEPDSLTSSPELAPAPDGPKPEITASNAETEASPELEETVSEMEKA